MKNLLCSLVLALTLLSCGGSDVATTTATASFHVGGTGGSRLPMKRKSGSRLSAGDIYLVSPNKAKITFTSIVYRDASGTTILTSELTDCVVTYDRSKASGAALLDCPFTAPQGVEIAQVAVYFDKTLQFLIDDGTTGIYSTTSGFTTTDPGEPEYFTYTITIGSGTSRSTPVIFPTPITIAAGETPTLYITTDMIHTMGLSVDAGGTTLSIEDNTDPVALFGGLNLGTSQIYTTATTIDSVKTSGVYQLRLFTDSSNNPLYIFGSSFCGSDDGPKGAWASPPIGAKIGGWLGKASSTLAWALPTSTDYTTYNAYFTMAEATNIGDGTTLNCKAATSPPAPTDGKTYASGAPTMDSPTAYSLTLRAK